MATKFVSALDGNQMDSALMDMATHTSEAWAVGTRNGTPVSGSDVTYHNNAKYYSDKVSTDTQRAEDAAARAEAAVPAGTAGAVFFDTAQSLTTAQQYQAKQNIGAATVNPNILDNPWFGAGSVVNQRGLTSWNTTGYFIDRWKIQTFNGAMSLTDNGLDITSVSSSAMMRFRQETPATFLKQIPNRPMTLSIMVNGDIYSLSGTVPSTQPASGDAGIATGTVMGGKIAVICTWLSTGVLRTDFRIYTPCTVTAVKLEIGAFSTLGYDAPTDYATELAKCQRYFIRLTAPAYGNGFGVGRAYSAYDCRVFFPLPVSLRTSPTVAATGLGNCALSGNGSSFSVTSVSYSGRSENGVSLSFAASGLTANQLYMLYRSGSDNIYIDISADL